MVLRAFHPAVRRWFTSELGEPSAPQRDGWPAILRGEHALIAAPTGSGKTLAAFLCAIDTLVKEGLGLEGDLPDETRVLYVSPLKALGNDIERNLKVPLAGVARELSAMGLPCVPIRTFVRSGDTSTRERSQAQKRPPQIVVTTPESLYLLLTSESGRRMLRSVRTVIIDEIHAFFSDRRGAHLALSLERLAALTQRPLQRIGLSATQRPIEEVAHFLVGSESTPCTIVDHGHRRDLRLLLEVPRSPLDAVMAHEVWDEVYDRLAELISAHRTTLVFVNTRRLAERVSKHLADRLGTELVTAHHGSLSREHRHRAEARLKAGELRALVATGSLELGIDIGSVELVCQLGATRSIASLLQRIGRSGHRMGAVSEGRIFPLSRDELVECVALVRAVRSGELEEVLAARPTLDVLAQQLVAAVAAEEWDEEQLFGLARRAYPYRNLSRADFDAVVRMLAEGFATARGRRGALLHHDRVHGRLRARRGARLTALTGGGTIPDNADYRVVLAPSGMQIGTVNEDFAVESMAGDVFQLGTSSWRILRVEAGVVRVEDARGTPPSIPFWLGEAPARSHALSAGVSRIRAELDAALSAGPAATNAWLQAAELPEAARSQLVDYLAASQAALSVLPTQDTLVAERFFDEAGGMQLVIHAPFGSRQNRAFGLALRKRFCRAFNFELQAAATEDAIVLSLGPTHSFPLAELREFLHARTVRDVLLQALLDAPMFETRFRWNSVRSLAVPRFSGGRKTAPHLLRMRANDLLAVVFPDQQACLENIQGDREIPDHPLVRQTVDDCLHEAMDIDSLETLLTRLERGEARFVFRELTEPSPLAAEVLGARPYAFLDDAPLEERRTQAVFSRRFMDVARAQELCALDAEAIARVCNEAWPSASSPDEAHDALVTLGYLTEAEAQRDMLPAHFAALATESRATRLHLASGRVLCCAAERLPELLAVHGGALLTPPIAAPLRDLGRKPAREDALCELVQARIDALGPCVASRLAAELEVGEAETRAALLSLEASGHVLRGRFTSGIAEDEFCERGLLARIHRLTIERLRREIEPVSAQDFMRFLFAWQRAAKNEQARGREGLYQVASQLAGFEAKPESWESEILPQRVRDYDPDLLDELCLCGRLRWARVSAPAGDGQRPGALRATPLGLGTSESLAAFRLCSRAEEPPTPSANAELVRIYLADNGASFLSELRSGTGLLPSVLESSLSELVSLGIVTSDGFAGLRALLVPARKHSGHPQRRSHALRTQRAQQSAGRWALLKPTKLSRDAALETVARTLLARYGVVFRKLLLRENLPPWRELVSVYRRLEARGEIRGGRFVDGFSGEHFALPDAIARLRRARNEPDETLACIAATDPLNLVGIVLPGERIAAMPRTRIVFRDGLALAMREAGRTHSYAELAPELRPRVSALLLGRVPGARIEQRSDPELASPGV